MIYNYEDKKKLAYRISNMQNKEVLKKIRDIIIINNPDIVMKKINNGYLAYFQNYTNKTYILIDECLNTYSKKIKIETSSNINNVTNATNMNYSNKDKRVIMRTRYEETLNNAKYEYFDVSPNDIKN